jgi:hypothetical protein
MCVMMWMFVGAFPNRAGDPGPPQMFFALIFGMVFLVQSIFIAPSFVAAYAMLKKKSCARVGAIVAAAMGAMNVPVGTGAAVYAFWFFMSENWKNVYPEQATRSGRRPGELGFNDEPAWHANQQNFQFDPSRTTPPDWR